MTYIDSLPGWKQMIARPISRAVYEAAVSLTDEELEAIVTEALIRARRDLSS
jgi:hypothetical protein